MRLAYLANYQGEDLIGRRGIRRNLALAGSRKIGEISRMLTQGGIEVLVFSLGAVAERRGRWHATLQSTLAPDNPVRVRYAVALDVPLLGQFVGLVSLWRAFCEEHAKEPFDGLVLYNMPVPEAYTAVRAARRWAIPIVLEYEDDVEIFADGSRNWKNRVWEKMRDDLRPYVRGVLAASPELLDQINAPYRMLLRGVLDDDMRNLGTTALATPIKILFAGSMQHSKGVDLLCEAWEQLRTPDTELHLVGAGQSYSALRDKYHGPGRTFHGLVPRERLVELMSTAWIFANPHRAGLHKPGNVSPFKLLEYLAAGRPVVSTRMGNMEPGLEQGICYAASQSPKNLARAIDSVVADYPVWAARSREAQTVAWQSYAPDVVAREIGQLVEAACNVSK
jgi:glycosyltransferase involved in cell wall biosynthesis